MTPQDRPVWKTVALVAGITLLAAAITFAVVMYFRNRKTDDGDENPYAKDTKPTGSAPSSGSSGSSSGSGSSGSYYTADEIKKMQTYMIVRANMLQNHVILDAIYSTGGIDGKIGSGFNKALKEAIRVGVVKDLKDLYVKSQVAIHE